jgi:AcrR family transcriptional regulator
VIERTGEAELVSELDTPIDRDASSRLVSPADMADSDPQNGNPNSPRPLGERDRIVAAFGRAAAERGYQGLNIESVARYADLSRARVEAHFESVESGLLATQRAYLERLRLDALDACAGSSDWPRRVRAALTSVIGSLAESSQLARVLSMEIAGASLGAAENRFEMLDGFAIVLAEGRIHSPAAASLPPLMEQMIVGGLASVIARHLLAEEMDALMAVTPELVELVLTPYVGVAEAGRIAHEDA